VGARARRSLSSYDEEMVRSSAQLARLRPYNLAAGGLHLAQAVAILVLANAFALPVQATYMTGPPGPTVGRQAVTLFDLGFAWAIAAFFALSALAHFGVAGPGWGSYQTELLRGRNPYRWLEYSLSSSIMIVLIAMLVGINDIAALVALVGVNASMIGFGWMQERYERPGAGLGPFWIGCVAGIVPWIAIAIYLVGPGADGRPPGFVYGIFFSLFVLFNCFALNQWLQYKQVGRWKDYLVGERVYVTLSLVAKSLLAWQIFAATMASGAAS
jgi:Heliorhodopsin